MVEIPVRLMEEESRLEVPAGETPHTLARHRLKNDGARRRLSGSRRRVGQRGLPDGGWREYGCSSMRML